MSYFLDEPIARLRSCCASDYEREPHAPRCQRTALLCESCGRYVQVSVLALGSDPTRCYRCSGPITVEVSPATRAIQRMQAIADQHDAAGF